MKSSNKSLSGKKTIIEKSFICEWCDNAFSTKSNLTVHQKSTSYCKELRNNIEIKPYKCEYCECRYTTEYNLKRHQTSCSDKAYKDQINSLKTHNAELVSQNSVLKRTIEELNVTITALRDEKSTLKEAKDILTGQVITYDKVKTNTNTTVINKNSNRYNNSLKYITNPATKLKLSSIPIDQIPALTDGFIKQQALTYTQTAFFNRTKGLVEFIKGFTYLPLEGSSIPQLSWACTDAQRDSGARLEFDEHDQEKTWKMDPKAHAITTILNNLSTVIAPFSERIDRYDALEKRYRDKLSSYSDFSDIPRHKINEVVYGSPEVKFVRTRNDLFIPTNLTDFADNYGFCSYFEAIKGITKLNVIAYKAIGEKVLNLKKEAPAVDEKKEYGFTVNNFRTGRHKNERSFYGNTADVPFPGGKRASFDAVDEYVAKNRFEPMTADEELKYKDRFLGKHLKSKKEKHFNTPDDREFLKLFKSADYKRGKLYLFIDAINDRDGVPREELCKKIIRKCQTFNTV